MTLREDAIVCFLRIPVLGMSACNRSIEISDNLDRSTILGCVDLSFRRNPSLYQLDADAVELVSIIHGPTLILGTTPLGRF